ncbi:MAG: helix-turn-helix domain-containing protein [Oscillospiraceae bacterium]|jgi:transcriptional regulator with XRE-family HTH domain
MEITDINEMKLITASNLIRLRTEKGMTQAELGSLLNYSDKTISKWERAEALPDAFVLKQIGEIFGVSVDFLLSEHGQWEKTQAEPVSDRRLSYTAITMVSISGIWCLAVLAFAVLWLLGSIQWLIFAVAVPVSLVTLLVLHSIWNGGKYNKYIIAALIISVLSLIYLLMIENHPWQVFLVALPAEAVVFLSFKIRKKH